MVLKERWKGVMERGKEDIQKGQTLREKESYFDSLVYDCSFMCIRILFYTCYPFLRICF
jgi:hypothetical protein